MFEIDKKSFGEFISMLRKEKSMTQKDLASRLLVSDKAVSKWETGNSMPDITLLVPLADSFVRHKQSGSKFFLCHGFFFTKHGNKLSKTFFINFKHNHHHL